MACHWKPLCHLSLQSKSADLSPGLWQNPIFFSHTTVLFRIHRHMVVPTGGCSMSCCSMDTWLSLLVNRLTWLCDDISAKLSSAICHWKLVKLEFSRWRSTDTWGPGSLLSPGVASSLDLDIIIFVSGCWSHCRLTLTFCRLDCDTFQFFLLRCAVFDFMIAVFFYARWLRISSC